MKLMDNTTNNINIFRAGIITSGIGIVLATTVLVLLLTSCQSVYQSQNKTNDGRFCPSGTQANKEGTECKTIVKEIVPENETGMQKLSRNLKKINQTLENTNNEMNPSSQNTGGNAGKEECLSWDDKCLERNNLKTHGKSRSF
jgi:hypothetical protein